MSGRFSESGPDTVEFGYGD